MLDSLGGLAGAQDVRTGGALPSRESATCDVAWAYETSTATRNTVCCSRRAGKTFTARRRAVRVLCGGPGRWVHCISLIRRNARKHFWNPICALLEELGWSYKSWSQDMILRLENGSYLQCLGVDDVSGVKRIQGDYSHLVIVDECHLPRDDIQRTLFAAAVPMLVDYHGAFDFVGLPPEFEPSVFSEAIDNPEWSAFTFTLLDHDYPQSRELKRARVEQDLKARGLTWDSPEAQRTYLGKRVRDPSSRAYEYQKGRNDYDPSTVDFDRQGWNHSVGLDFGYQDRDAVVVEAWRFDDPERHAYVRFAWQRNHLSTDALADVVMLVGLVYRPVAWTYDTGGHGAVKVGETLKERLRVEMEPKPPDVMLSLGFVNDDLRTGRLLIPTADTETPRVLEAARQRFAGRPSELARVESLLLDAGANVGAELAMVPKMAHPRTLKLTINPKGPNHSDISEALRYAHAGCQAWRSKAPVAELTGEEMRKRSRRRSREVGGRW